MNKSTEIRSTGTKSNNTIVLDFGDFDVLFTPENPKAQLKKDAPKKDSTPKATRRDLESTFSKANNPITCPTLISFSECKDVAKKDAAILCGYVSKQFVDTNYLTYYVLIHTWIYQCWDYSPEGSYALLQAIKSQGCVACINDCSNLASKIIRMNDKTAKQFVNMEYLGIEYPYYLRDIVNHAPTITKALQILRYPKRFSPIHATAIEAKTYDAFVSINERCNSSYKYNYFTPHVRWWIKKLVGGYKVDDLDSYFSSGSTADGGKLLVNKLRCLAENEHEIWGIPMETRTYSCAPAHKNFVKFKVVPKSYKIGRGIAMEEAARQFHLQAIREGLLKALRANGFGDYFNPNDQEPSRRIAVDASLNGRYATIDLSSASDSISVECAYDLFALVPDFLDDIKKYGPEVFVTDTMEYADATKVRPLKRGVTHGSGPDAPCGYGVDDNCHAAHDVYTKGRLNIFLTSGDAVTFNAEAVIFLAICLAAGEFYTNITGDTNLVHPVVYGDDIEVDAKIMDTVIDMLGLFGMIPNYDKSYGAESNYRESCGVEAVYGRDTTTLYFPRKTLVWEDKDLPMSIASLIDLQHRLYACSKVNSFLTNLVKAFIPDMTSHVMGSECADLWGPTEVYKPLKAPHKGALVGSVVLTTPDTAGKTKRQVPLQTVTLEDVALRKGHYSLVMKYGSSVAITREQEILLDAWRYARFLAFGPQYEDDLSEVLHIPMKTDNRTDYMNGESVWRIIAD